MAKEFPQAFVGKVPSVIFRYNPASDKFGSFNRDSFLIFNYVVASLNHSTKITPYTTVEISLKSMSTVVYGTSPKRSLSQSRIQKLHRACVTMIKTPIAFANGNRYLFGNVILKNQDTDDPVEVFEFVDDLITISYFYGFQENYYKYSIRDIVSINNENYLKLFALCMGKLKGKSKVNFSETFEQLNHILKGNDRSIYYKKMSNIGDLLNRACDYFNKENPIISSSFYFNFKKVKADHKNKIKNYEIIVVNKHYQDSDDSQENIASSVDLLEQKAGFSSILDYYRKTKKGSEIDHGFNLF